MVCRRPCCLISNLPLRISLDCETRGFIQRREVRRLKRCQNQAGQDHREAVEPANGESPGIGIRRAVGATKSDIIKQFVWEALTLSSLGGIIGIIIGIIISFILDGQFTFDDFTLRTVIQPWSIIIAFAVSFAIGLVSGVYPAFRASRLDPILALRNE